MAAKLIIHKFEEGINFKSLHITINNRADKPEAEFGHWLEGKPDYKKDTTKPRLIVKLVSGDDNDNFSLESCAKKIADSDQYYNWNNCISYKNELTSLISKEIECNSTTGPYNRIEGNKSVSEKDNGTGTFFKPLEYSIEKANGNNARIMENIHNLNKSLNHTNCISYKNELTSIISKEIDCNSTTDPYNGIEGNKGINEKDNGTGSYFNPLEYSIEKVKENNARIMENIHMLNRTLNYTKKKEILDIICPKSLQPYSCETCGKGFVYETGLKRHYASRHALTDPHPRWQVVWTCTECFQVWPRNDLALKHTMKCCNKENADCIREIKTSSLLQCEFCEQAYTNIPRLLKHSKTHVVTSNFECRTCNISFVSYKSAELHWHSCSWVNTCYKFSLPKMLLCNICDRKFKNYEQLYNHRYKVGHFIAKTHSDHNVVSISMLAYQCEICAQWFHLAQALIIHKNQDHPGLDTGL